MYKKKKKPVLIKIIIFLYVKYVISDPSPLKKKKNEHLFTCPNRNPFVSRKRRVRLTCVRVNRRSIHRSGPHAWRIIYLDPFLSSDRPKRRTRFPIVVPITSRTKVCLPTTCAASANKRFPCPLHARDNVTRCSWFLRFHHRWFLDVVAIRLFFSKPAHRSFSLPFFFQLPSVAKIFDSNFTFIFSRRNSAGWNR